MQVQFELLRSGYCRHPEFVALRTGGLRSCKFPALFGVIIHPSFGVILYDTGYAPRFLEESRRLPEIIYRKLIPVHCSGDDTALTQVRRLGFSPGEVKYVILSHFHADHIAGVRDFPNAKMICSRAAFAPLANKGRIAATLNGFVKGLLPHDFRQRCVYVEDHPRVTLDSSLRPFAEGFDLLGDRSLIAVELPGHVHGQLGLYLTDLAGRQIFLAADACWFSRSYRDLILPHTIARIAIADWAQYRQTLGKLHDLHLRNPDLAIIPSHCEEAAALLRGSACD